MELEDLLDHTVEDSIVNEERIRIKAQIRAFDPETPYYVYFLCFPNGQPFYVGKGKGKRVFGYFQSDFANQYKTEIISQIQESGSYPIIHIAKGNLKEDAALKLEQRYIQEYGRSGIDENGILTNIHPGGNFGLNSQEICSLAGKRGGKTTKANKSGIFADDYDRGKQSRKNWELGLLDHIDFKEIGRIAGRTAVEVQVGIHNPDYSHKRVEWAKIGAEALEKSGNRGGVCSKQWMSENPEKVLENSSKGGKIGGKVTGSKPWWNNGTKNIRSYNCPGENWVRGMLKNIKSKLNQSKEKQ